MFSLRCRPSRFGASSPSTSEKNAMTSVTPTSAITPAAPSDMPRVTRYAATRSDTVAAPSAEESRVATVTPICTEARNRFGSDTSSASRRPRTPLVAASCST